MAENENVVVEEQVNSSDKPSFGAKCKEWFRKKIVGLKRKPQNIALFFLLVASVYFMFALYPVTASAYAAEANLQGGNPFAGLCIFLSTLLSLLILVSFLNAFPKRKKPNIVFIVMVYVMAGAIIGFDLWYYFQMQTSISRLTIQTTIDQYKAGQPFIIAHVIMIGVFVVIFSLLPVYKRLINMINTSVKLESATENMKQIDIQED